MKSRYPSPNHEWKVDTRAVGKGIYFSWVVGARVSTFHEWLVRKYLAHPTKIPRVGGGIIDLHHEPTLERVFELNTRYVAGIWTKYPLQSINMTFSHATIAVAGIHCKMDV